MSSLQEQLAERVEAADTKGVLDLLAPLDESERAALADGARAMYEEAVSGAQTAHEEDVRRATERHQSESPEMMFFPPRRLPGRREQVAALARFATGDSADLLPEVGRYPEFEWLMLSAKEDSEAFERALRERGRAWLETFVESHTAWLSWNLVWRLVADGRIPRPESAWYLYGLADGPWDTDAVQRDTALIEVDLPRLLARPGGVRLVVVSNWWRHPGGRGNWRFLLAALPDRHLVRERLLDGTLDEIAGDLPTREARMCLRFLEILAPSIDELVPHRRRLLAMVSDRNPAVVSAAVQALTRLDHVGQLPAADVLAGVPAALHARAKRTAGAALALIAAVADREPRCARDAALALIPALTHPLPDVQRAAVRVLTPHAHAHPEVARAASAALPDMSPGIAETCRDALGLAAVAADTAVFDADLAELEAASRSLPPEVSRPAGVDAALAAALGHTEPPAVRIDPWRFAFPDPSVAIRPVEDADELIGLLLRLLDGPASVMDAERALDGLAALGAGPIPELERRIGPLARRVEDWHGPTAGMPRAHFRDLVSIWVQPELGAPPAISLDSAGAWLGGRMREVALDLVERRTRRLLALPTDPRGWIEPATLVARVAAGGDARPMDAASALMRLAPWGRAEALTLAASLEGPLGRAVRAACSGKEAADVPPMIAGALHWLRTWPHEGPPWRFGGPDDWVYPGVTEDHRLELSQEWAGQALAPAVGFNVRWYFVPYDRGCWPGWQLRQWPGDHDWTWWEPVGAPLFVDALLDPDEPLPADALATVLVALARFAPEDRTLAADVLAQAIGDGRVDSTMLAAALIAHFGLGAVTRSVPSALGVAAACSPLHRAVVRRALTGSLPGWRACSRQVLCDLLEVLNEVCAAGGVGVGDPRAREELTALATGRSKSATLARTVLARATDGDQWPAGATAAAVAARVERAQRWASTHPGSGSRVRRAP